jgi:hypothetical protein
MVFSYPLGCEGYLKLALTVKL